MLTYLLPKKFRPWATVILIAFFLLNVFKQAKAAVPKDFDLDLDKESDNEVELENDNDSQFGGTGGSGSWSVAHRNEPEEGAPVLGIRPDLEDEGNIEQSC